jgi:response regulator RpfG family c-di-GMP phosphodiesterase
MSFSGNFSSNPETPRLVQFEMRPLEDGYRNQVLAMACTLVSLVDLWDSYTAGHSTRVAEYSRRMALQLQLNDCDAEMVTMVVDGFIPCLHRTYLSTADRSSAARG